MSNKNVIKHNTNSLKLTNIRFKKSKQLYLYQRNIRLSKACSITSQSHTIIYQRDN